MELNNEDYATNRNGALADSQIKTLRRGGYVNITLALIFFACTPVAFISYDPDKIFAFVFLLLFFLGAGALFTWMSKEEFRLSKLEPPCVKSIGGVLVVNFRGKMTSLEIGGQVFRLRSYMIKNLKSGSRYEFFYIDTPKKLIGWKLMS